MQIVKSVAEMQRISLAAKMAGKKVALVPTMGFLHSGHASLIKKARELADVVITSVFVNPTQFAPNEDYESYPRDLEHDKKIAEDSGCDFIFHPDPLEMYPVGFSSSISIKGVTSVFEGARRPTHFDGVALVVAKLFNAARPDVAVFGQKDYQQTLVLKRLNADLNFGIDIVIAPIVRESNGLAMSSRNSYLTQEEKQKAGVLFLALEEAKRVVLMGETDRKRINAVLIKTLRAVPEIRIDYACAADAQTLDEPDVFLPGDRIVLLLAVYLGKTRLIDNSVATVPRRLTDANFVEGL